MRRRTATVRTVASLALAALVVFGAPAAPALASWSDTASPVNAGALSTGAVGIQAQTSAVNWTSGGAAFNPLADSLSAGQTIQATIPVTAIATGTTMTPTLSIDGADQFGQFVRFDYEFSSAVQGGVAGSQSLTLTVSLQLVANAPAGYTDAIDASGLILRLDSGRVWEATTALDFGRIAVGVETVDPGPEVPGIIKEDCENFAFQGMLIAPHADGPFAACHGLGTVNISHNADGSINNTVQLPTLWLMYEDSFPIYSIAWLPAFSSPSDVAWNVFAAPTQQGNGLVSSNVSVQFQNSFLDRVAAGTDSGEFVIALRDTARDGQRSYIWGRVVVEPAPAQPNAFALTLDEPVVEPDASVVEPDAPVVNSEYIEPMAPDYYIESTAPVDNIVPTAREIYIEPTAREYNIEQAEALDFADESGDLSPVYDTPDYDKESDGEENL